jgi:hypothetical protein
MVKMILIYTCDKCGAETQRARQVDLFEDPVIHYPKNWGSDSKDGLPADGVLFCPACKGEPGG